MAYREKMGSSKVGFMSKIPSGRHVSFDVQALSLGIKFVIDFISISMCSELVKSHKREKNGLRIVM